MKAASLLRLWVLLAVASIPVQASADDAPLPSLSVPNLPWGVQFDLPSKISGRTYRIFVRKPDSAAPATGYPVVTLADGNVFFPTAALASITAEVSNDGAALIVAVGYPFDDIKRLTVIRNRDLTPTQPKGGIRQYPGYPTMTEADFAGAELYLRFLTEELRPLIARMYPVDAARQTLVGHSLGGLFVLKALFQQPDAFNHYVASSPSIWWNEREILADVPAFEAKLKGGGVQARLLITAGSREDDLPKQLPPGMTPAQAKADIQRDGIITNGMALATRLAAAPGAPGFSVRTILFDGEHHNSVVPPMIGRAVLFGLEP